MGGKSSIARLPAEIRAECDAAIKRGATIDAILAVLRDLGAEVSRSAVGRYAQKYNELAENQRELASVAAAFGREFGEDDNRESRLMTQLLTSLATRVILPLASDEDPELDGKELHYLARAVKDAASASKIGVDREAKIREEERKRAREDAATAAEGALRSAGASDESVRRVKAEILGIAA